MYKKILLEIKALFILAIPVLFTQITQISINVINNLILGHFSNIDIIAFTISISIWFPIILLGHGILLSLIPIISQLYGVGNFIYIKYKIHQVYLLSILLSFIIMLIIYIISIYIKYIPNTHHLLFYKVSILLKIILWSTPAYLFLQILRCIFEGLTFTIPMMIISFLGMLCYIPLNFMFIYGFYFIPRVGGLGCGLSIVIIYWIMCIMALIWFIISKSFKNIFTIKFITKPNFTIFKKILILGLPIGLSIFFEVTLFTIVSLFIYSMGIEQIISHQIALNISSFIFIIAFSLSTAVTIRIGYFLGYNKKIQAKQISWITQIVGMVITILISSVIIYFRKNIISLYNQDINIINLSSKLVLLSVLYQIPDTIHIIGIGILKGYKDTISIFLITFLSYWIIGLPIGYILSLTHLLTNNPMGPAGFWVGFVVALTISSVLTIYRIIIVQQKH
ncbi:MATE family efflux transporter [Enterobacteriaceae endosymbiont of Neohaemonia nigricornis]|uniref:MATE family efflux transporter n=1 Tax=Enterobacteriaceae endosymbiont of Neohaemonia nigricornis TaxID=2675792 RepID=UPI00144990A1|nr:MATE family efflux transporter [Enterobacteriaceae endosymbiont of Neohaemonia nigricornis]QJC30313.1 MATE family efflux transporter [Enterobacteriaceae endosymbiont of Neohaemonia nigricornis]